MAYTGDSRLKRTLQAPFKALGYKVVRLKPYEQRGEENAAGGRGAPKVFCIGFNKTATTTLEAVLRENGYKMPKQLDQESLLKGVIENRDFDLLRQFVEEYDAFQDLPFSQFQTYIVCDALFPGSKFILTRRDPDRWVDSYIRYYRAEFGLEDAERFSEATFRGKNLYLAKGYVHSLFGRLLTETLDGQPVTRWDLAFDRDRLRQIYQRRNAEIIAYFAHRPDDLLVIDPTREADTERLLKFLGLRDVEPGPFPRLNAQAV